MSKKVVIIGGVAGGASAAARLRRNDETIEIVIFEKGEYISFANCGLPYYIGETISKRDALLLQTPEAMKSRFNIDVKIKSEVISINREEKTVLVKNLITNSEYTESYDTLILSPGSKPLKPPIQGIESPGIFSLWNIPDTDKIKSFVDDKKPTKAAIIGGGFIGLEMAENLYERGLNVSVIEMADQVMAPIDFEMAAQIHSHMIDKGVNLVLNDGVDKFEHNNGITTTVLKSGKKIDAEIIILSIGIRPQSELAQKCGLKLNQRGGIIVDEYLKTSDPNIYAVGDVIQVKEFIEGFDTMVPLAGPANKQGRIVANNITGSNEKYKGTQGTSIAKVFDLTVASTGLNEKTLLRIGKKYKKDYEIAILHSKSHAGYYPGAIPMTIKLIFSVLDGKVLGAQIVGYDGVDKRIDVIATSIRFGSTIYDLKELELAYAPPYSSAKDPVNMAGFTAENILNGTHDVIMCRDVEYLDMNKTILLDVREPIERNLGFIENSINIPVDLLRNRLNELDKNKEIIVYCAIGIRGYIASRILKQNGFTKVKNISGGYASYSYLYCDHNTCNNDDSCCYDASEFSDLGDMKSNITPTGKLININACGLQCPGPIMQVYHAMEELASGDELKVLATDPGFTKDIITWCQKTGNTLIDSGKENKNFFARIMKGNLNQLKQFKHEPLNIPNNKTMVIFSNDFDKAIAALIIANGAAAMGRKVTMFYTFWGLNILRKSNSTPVKKDFISKIFGLMMPKGTKQLKLSKLNMGGLGSKLMRNLMNQNNIDSLETLLQNALDNGVNMIACNMSMDLMGIKKEELIDGIELGGVASYLGEAEDSDTNLFI